MSSYCSFEELIKHEAINIDYRIRVRHGTSGIAVMAIHGGGIEPGTTEIAESLAADKHTFYTFSGIKAAHNSRLYIPSQKFDDPLGVETARNADTVVTIHGCRDMRKIVYLGEAATNN